MEFVFFKSGCNKKMVPCGTLFKSCMCCLILRKHLFFLESVSFHHEVFDVSSFRLVLGVYIVHVVIFIKKYLVNMFRISFSDFLRILTMTTLKMLEKSCHVNFFQFDKQKCKSSKDQKHHQQHLKKNKLCGVFGFLIIHIIYHQT